MENKKDNIKELMQGLSKMKGLADGVKDGDFKIIENAFSIMSGVQKSIEEYTSNLNKEQQKELEPLLKGIKDEVAKINLNNICQSK